MYIIYTYICHIIYDIKSILCLSVYLLEGILIDRENEIQKVDSFINIVHTGSFSETFCVSY